MICSEIQNDFLSHVRTWTCFWKSIWFVKPYLKSRVQCRIDETQVVLAVLLLDTRHNIYIFYLWLPFLSFYQTVEAEKSHWNIRVGIDHMTSSESVMISKKYKLQKNTRHKYILCNTGILAQHDGMGDFSICIFIEYGFSWWRGNGVIFVWLLSNDNFFVVVKPPQQAIYYTI